MKIRGEVNENDVYLFLNLIPKKEKEFAFRFSTRRKIQFLSSIQKSMKLLFNRFFNSLKWACLPKTIFNFKRNCSLIEQRQHEAVLHKFV